MLFLLLGGPPHSTWVALVIVLAPKEWVQMAKTVQIHFVRCIVCDFMILAISCHHRKDFMSRFGLFLSPFEGRKWAFGDAMRRARPTGVNEGSGGPKQTLYDTCVVFLVVTNSVNVMNWAFG